MLERVVRLAKPITLVELEQPRRAERGEQGRDHLVGDRRAGSWLAASAYSITWRSNGENTVDARQRGTSRALSSSRPLSRAMK